MTEVDRRHAIRDYRRRAPAVSYAHRTVDHFVPLFISIGASLDTDARSRTAIEGFWMANSKRSLEFRSSAVVGTVILGPVLLVHHVGASAVGRRRQHA